MGLSKSSVGRHALNDTNLDSEAEKVLLIGNPNVGKSTIFNYLTGLNQHTGNWTGKTVGCAYGICKENGMIIADLPGCYSLFSRSREEEVSRDLILLGDYSRAVVVCDASCLERNLCLFLQVLESCPDTVLCVNLADEAQKNGITVDGEALESFFGVPVVVMSAKKGAQIRKLYDVLKTKKSSDFRVKYPESIEDYIKDIHSLLIGQGITYSASRLFALKLLENNPSLTESLCKKYGITEATKNEAESLALTLSEKHFSSSTEKTNDALSKALSDCSAKACSIGVKKSKVKNKKGLNLADRLLMGRLTAFPLMLVLLFFILFLTVKGANYPSSLLREFFIYIEELAYKGLCAVHIPNAVTLAICEGMIRVVGWVVSVMLPPMAIFFPLFTLLEDIGYLPRIAFNLDKCFKGCNACGKQGLTMCMGLGCNAAGVVGCRIIDSPREKDIAILTNSLVPCNGRFPMLIAMISVFFASSGMYSALILTSAILVSVIMTLISSKVLSKTVLKGSPSSFVLELPPFRVPNIWQVIVRSVYDRTLFVLGRAVAVAAPTGLFIWLISNINIGDASIITHLSCFFDPLGTFIGLDGVIILAFILGLPANEIVIPIMLMCYLNSPSLNDYASLNELKNILVTSGWTYLTALNFIIFTLFHWPCSTTILSIKKETSSIKKTAVAVLLPTVIGVCLCLITRIVFEFFA